MGRNVWISHLVYLDALYPDAITIAHNVTIGLRSTIFTHFHRSPARAHGYRPVTIEDDVFVGPQCVVLPGVRIGHGAVIKAGSVLSRNVPPLTFWGADEGRPFGRVTVPLTSEHDYSEFIQGLRLFRPRGPAARTVETEEAEETFCERFDI
jgi:acyl-[acyl carrier protein]--UDP-N-acetylglucosamine O-acyltransferase